MGDIANSAVVVVAVRAGVRGYEEDGAEVERSSGQQSAWVSGICIAGTPEHAARDGEHGRHASRWFITIPRWLGGETMQDGHSGAWAQ